MEREKRINRRQLDLNGKLEGTSAAALALARALWP